MALQSSRIIVNSNNWKENTYVFSFFFLSYIILIGETGCVMFKFSNVELKNSEEKLLHYVSNDNLLKYLMDNNEITLLVNLFKAEMMIW